MTTRQRNALVVLVLVLIVVVALIWLVGKRAKPVPAPTPKPPVVTPTPTPTPKAPSPSPTPSALPKRRSLVSAAAATPTPTPSGVSTQVTGTVVSWSNGVMTLNVSGQTQTFETAGFAESDTSPSIGMIAIVVYDTGNRQVGYIKFPTSPFKEPTPRPSP